MIRYKHHWSARSPRTSVVVQLWPAFATNSTPQSRVSARNADWLIMKLPSIDCKLHDSTLHSVSSESTNSACDFKRISVTLNSSHDTRTTACAAHVSSITSAMENLSTWGECGPHPNVYSDTELSFHVLLAVWPWEVCQWHEINHNYSLLRRTIRFHYLS